MFSNSLLGPGFAVSTSAVGVWGEHLRHFTFFHLGGHMGFSITASAVTVTVATFDTLAFCEMKFSQKAEEPTSAKAPENTLSIRKLHVCFALVSIAARCSCYIKWQKKTLSVYITSEKRRGKKSLFFNSLCLSLQCFEDFYKGWIIESFPWIMHIIFQHSHRRCGAMHPRGWQMTAARI